MTNEPGGMDDQRRLLSIHLNRELLFAIDSTGIYLTRKFYLQRDKVWLERTSMSKQVTLTGSEMFHE